MAVTLEFVNILINEHNMHPPLLQKVRERGMGRKERKRYAIIILRYIYIRHWTHYELEALGVKMYKRILAIIVTLLICCRFVPYPNYYDHLKVLLDLVWLRVEALWLLFCSMDCYFTLCVLVINNNVSFK